MTYEAVGQMSQADGQCWQFHEVADSPQEARDTLICRIWTLLRERHDGDRETLDTLEFLRGWSGSDLTIAGYETWVDVYTHGGN